MPWCQCLIIICRLVTVNRSEWEMHPAFPQVRRLPADTWRHSLPGSGILPLAENIGKESGATW